MSTYPRTFSHIGISVPDVEKAVEFYSKVMGWYQIMKPTLITEVSDTPIGQMCIDVFGEGWGSFKIAHMSTGDKIGVEMFEFKNNESPCGQKTHPHLDINILPSLVCVTMPLYFASNEA